MKKIIYIAAALALLAGCSKSDPQPAPSVLLIDNEHTLAVGSYVQGTALSNLCKINIPYDNAVGGTAKFSCASTVNGLTLATTTVELGQGSGIAVLSITGTPIQLISTFMPITVEYNGKTYITSVEIPVASDPDPNGTVTFTMDATPIINLDGSVTRTFTVNPTMTSVQVTSTAITGLSVSASVPDMSAGTGSFTFTSGPAFLSGTVVFTAEFGARPTQTISIPVSAFASGDGSAALPYQITNAVQLAKLNYATTKAFILNNAVTASSWTPVGTSTAGFAGTFDGNNQTITLNINTPTADNVGFFGYIAAGATVKNVKLAGSVTGQNYVAALAANSAVAVTNCDVTGVDVTGTNYVAAAIANGTAKDARIITFGTVPATLNILVGNTQVTSALGVTPLDVVYTGNPGATGTTSAYNTTTGILTVTKGGTFTAGDMTFSVKLASTGLGSRVASATRTINLQSKKMFESGTGISTDPYMVKDGDQFTATISTSPTAYVTLMNNIIDITSWTRIPSFGGVLDGAGYSVTNLTDAFCTTNTGTIKNIKFTNFNKTNISGAAFGAVACTNSGLIDGVAVTGTIEASAGASGGDTGLGAIAGFLQNGGRINNCYVNMTSFKPFTNYTLGGIAGCINTNSTGAAVTISNCTVEGSMTVGAVTKVGGIVGRKLNGNAAVTDKIINCQVSANILGALSGSNMVGGIFGGFQPGTGFLIDQCMFNGRVQGENTVGGIGGVCPEVSNCMVVGAGSDISAPATVSATAGGGTATSSSAGIVSAAKMNISKCIVANAKIVSPTITSTPAKYGAAVIGAQNAGTPVVSACVVIGCSLPAPTTLGDNTTGGRVFAGTNTTTYTVNATNYYNGIVYNDGTAFSALSPDTRNQDGTSVAAAAMTQAWYVTLGYDFTTIWAWDAVNSRPKLQSVGCAPSVKP